MSSLTDIIFLLLIFFMLTSSLVTPNALNLQLPGNKRSTSTSNDSPARINIETNGNILLNGTRVSLPQLEARFKDLKRAKGNNAVVSVSPTAGSSNVELIGVLDLAYRYEIKTSLTDPR